MYLPLSFSSLLPGSCRSSPNKHPRHKSLAQKLLFWLRDSRLKDDWTVLCYWLISIISFTSPSKLDASMILREKEL